MALFALTTAALSTLAVPAEVAAAAAPKPESPIITKDPNTQLRVPISLNVF